jgi:hypothetical protein
VLGGSLNSYSTVDFSSLILYIKVNVVSVCVDKNWAVLGRLFQSLPVPCGACSLSVVTNRAGQGSRCGRLGEVPFLLKKSLGKTGGPASNQTKIQIIFKLFSL